MVPTCPENQPFNFGFKCCAVQPNAEGDCPEGADHSNCNDHYPEPGRYACADHPTAVRVEGNFFSYGHFDEKMLGTYKGQKFRQKTG